ncbi:hypothetical protein RhiirA1_536795 [Rhizophagus irregularis]|uniref:Protein kinase domain-containing protein n=1 Tax=Rhizophagus irregularis TaxID=588596 RepID=A0A2N0RN99_9GLOM|nr:hypothetical protein RhiirA1_536795 [Rhizophagus irregularis]
MDETPKKLWKGTDTSKYQVIAINIFNNHNYFIEFLFKDNFKNWTSGNKDIDKFIQQTQINAVHCKKYLEWIPFEKFQNITYIAEGGFGKIYSAEWPEGYISYWDIENQSWCRYTTNKYALKSLNNSSDICPDFLNEIKSHLQVYLVDIVPCYGITQDPNNKEYMMVIKYCNDGNLRNYLNKSKNYINYNSKIDKLQQIARGLLDIHNAEKKWYVEIKVIEYSEDSKDGEDGKNIENGDNNQNSEIYFQLKECDKIRKEKIKNRSNEDKSKSFQTHPQAIYTSRLLNFKNLLKPVNSSDLSSFQFNSDTSYIAQSTSENQISECLDVQLSELELNEICQDDEHNIE